MAHRLTPPRPWAVFEGWWRLLTGWPIIPCNFAMDK